MVARRIDCIAYISNRKILLIYLTDPRISSNQEILNITKKLRGGNLSLVVTLRLIAFFVVALSGSEVEGFISNWGVNRNRPDLQPPGGSPTFPPYYDAFSPRRTPGSPRAGSTLYITRPSDMTQPEFSKLTKAEKRSLYNYKYMRINRERYPELDVGYWQSEYKVRKHGAIHGLAYTTNEETNGTITNRTEANALAMMQSVVDMANGDKVEWIINGTYQANTTRGFEAIHIYEPSTRRIVVFKKSTSKFVTTC